MSLANAGDLGGIHRILRQGTFLDQGLQMAAVHRFADRLRQPRPHFRAVAVADGLDQQIAQWAAFELQLAQHVEHLAAEGEASLLQLVEQRAVNVAFAGFRRHQVPQMADLRLADAMDAPEALLQAVGVPRQVIVHHQVGALQVDAFAGGVRSQQHLCFRVVQEGFLGLAAFLPPHAAVNDGYRVWTAQQRADAPLQIVQGVTVLREHHQLLARRRPGRGNGAAATVTGLLFRHRVRQRARRENHGQQVGEFLPLGVLAAAPQVRGQGFQAPQRVDFGLQFGDAAGGGGLVEHGGLRRLHFIERRFLQILHILGIQGGAVEKCAALQQGRLPQPAFKTLPPPAQGLVDGCRRGRQAPLQNGQRETDGAGPLVVVQGFGAVELLSHIVRDGFVETRLGGREPVRHRVGDALREQRAAVEPQQVLLDHAAHQVGHIHLVDAVAEAALETIAIQQCQEQLKVLLLAVVRRSGHQQEVTGDAGEQLAQAITLGVLDLAAKEGRGHLVGFVAHHQVITAIGRSKQGLQIFAAGQFVQPGDGEIVFQEPIAGAGRFQLVVGEDVERQLKAAMQLVLPLLGQAPGAYDQAALQVAAHDQFLHQQPGHDGLAGAGVVRQQEAQRLARQHSLVNGGDLVRQRLHQGGVDG